jgi:multidrug efflux pump subunit AcrA (membrane-fusion protein)
MEDRLEKKKKKKHIGIIVLIIVAIVLIGLIASAVSQARVAMQELTSKNIQSYEVSRGTVVETVSGSGQVEAAESVDVTVPVGVEVDKVLVSSGDTVQKGQELAEINTESITDALVSIESSIKSIDDELKADESRSSGDEDKLTDLQKEQLNNEKTDLQTAQDELNQLKSNPVITATTDGIIGDVNISEGSETAKTSGSSSYSSGDSSDASSYLQSITGVASSAVVSGKPTAVVADVRKVTPVGSAAADQYVTIVTGETTSSSSVTGSSLSEETDSSSSGATDSSSASEETSSSSSSEESSEDSSEVKDSVISDWSALTGKLTAPAADGTPVTTEDIFADTESGTFSDLNHYTGQIRWIDAASANETVSRFEAGHTYVAVISLTAADGWIFSGDNIPGITGASQVEPFLGADGKTLTLVVIYPQISAGDTSDQTVISLTDEQIEALKNAINSAVDASQDLSGLDLSSLSSGTSSYDLSSLSSGTSSYDLSGLSSGTSSYDLSGTDVSGITDTGSSVSVSYSPYECVAFTINKTDRVQVKVSIDEQDILLLSEGQTAEVTLDAVDGETFEGTVTKIASTATESSGSAKYEVTVEMDGSDNIRLGMTAQATVNVGEAEDALVIPMEALQQEEDKNFVYTTEAEDGTLGGEKEVTTGLSDGENVEIKSGLSEGDTIYYTQASDTSTDMFGDEISAESGEQ